MRSSLTILFVFLTLNYLNAQQSQWLEGIHGTDNDVGTDVARDPAGNPIYCGYFSSDTLFAGTQFLAQKSIETDAYVIKYNSNGDPVWMDNPGGPIGQKANSLAADISGNIYVTGTFLAGFSFGSSFLESLNGEDGMLLKYDSEGNNIWGVSLGSIGSVKCNKLVIDSEGYIYVSGFYSGPFINIGDTTLNNNGDFDIFVAKYNPQGELLWAQSFGGPGGDYIIQMCEDEQDNIYISGGFKSDEITFGNYTFPNLATTRASYVTKIDPNGNIQWADSHTNSYDQQYNGITIDAENSIYIAGYFKGTFNFGTYTFITTGSQYDIMLIKYNSSYEPQWARHIYSPDYDRANDLDHDNEGNIYLTAIFKADILIEDIVLYNNGGSDFFIAKYNSQGDLTWAHSIGNTENEECSSLVFGEPWSVYFTGYFESDYIYWGQQYVINQGMKDSFIGSVYTYLSASIDDNHVEEEIHFYPNPVKDEIIFSKQVYRAKLYDLNGRLILSEENTSRITVAKGLPPAIYLLMVTPSEKEQTQTFKVLKQ